MANKDEAQARRAWVLEALEKFEPMLIRYAQRLTQGDWDRTREAVQHTFVKLCQQDPDAIAENLGGWLCAVCRNKVFDDARTANRQPQLDEGALASRPSNSDGPAHRIEQSELIGLLEKRIENLPAAQRSAIELWRTGISYAEIATLLDRDQTAIRVAVHRAIAALKADPAIAAWLGDQRNEPDSVAHPAPRVNKSLGAVL
jgi:RNA polymerase sigma-70 factor (ECF subfamily)